MSKLSIWRMRMRVVSFDIFLFDICTFDQSLENPINMLKICKLLPVIKEPGPYITACHIRFKFGSIPLGKTQNLCGATPSEGPCNQRSPYNHGGLSILEGGLLYLRKPCKVITYRGQICLKK